MRSFSDKEKDLNDSLPFYHIPLPNDYHSGYLLKQYLILSGDTLSSFVRMRQWTDSLVGDHHYEYQHYFMNIPVIGAILKEHFSNQGLYLINGQIGLFDGIDTLNLDLIDPPDVAVLLFLRSYFGYPADTTYYFAWQDTLWEQQIKTDMEDSTATWYPKARLVWVAPKKGYTPGPYIKNLRLAYEIRVFCLRPFFDTLYYVNAFKPWEIIYKRSVILHINQTSTNNCNPGYGIATIWNYGNRCIDTKQKSERKYILYADNYPNDFVTKKWSPIVPCNLLPNYTDSDNDWGTRYQNGTSIHWFLQTSIDAMYHNFSFLPSKHICVKAENRIAPKNASTRIGTRRYILTVGRKLSPALDVVAHEYGHIILRQHIPGYNDGIFEAAAIEEAFCDITAVYIEHYVEGKGADWEIAEDANISSPIRSLSNPDILNGSSAYYDATWISTNDPHYASTAIGKWAYLLSEGGQGTNFLGNQYNVQGIGLNKTYTILYYAIKNILPPSPYISHFVSSIFIAEQRTYNNCFIKKQIKQAFWAVNMVQDSSVSCSPTYSAQPINSTPAHIICENNTCIIHTKQPTHIDIYLTDLTGKILMTYKMQYKRNLRINLNTLPTGFYILQIKQNGITIGTQRVVKQ